MSPTIQDVKGRRNHLCRQLSLQTGDTSVDLKLQLADKYLDPFPDDVDEAFRSIITYLERLGQHEKIAALDRLWENGLLKVQGTVYDQADFCHRVLLFLIRVSSGNVQDTRVDPQCQRVIKVYCTNDSVDDRIRREDERTLRKLQKEDEEHEDGQWWRRRVVYSSGDELSDWSGVSEEDGDDDDSERDDSTVRDSDTGDFTTPQGGREKSMRGDTAGSSSADTEMPCKAWEYPEQKSKPMIREVNWQLAGTESMESWKTAQPKTKMYTPQSLSVWFASKMCTSHLSDALNPRYCVSEDVIVKQMLNCILGYRNPGFTCSWNETTGEYMIKPGVHLENVSVGAIQYIAREILEVANALKYVEIRIGLLKKKIHTVVESQSIVLSQLYALDRQIRLCREYCEQEASGRSLMTLLHAISAIKQPSRLLEHLCQMISTDENRMNNVKKLIDAMQSNLETLHLECSSGWTVTIMGLILEILLSMLIPFTNAMDTLMRYGSSGSLPIEFRLSCDIQDNHAISCPSMFEHPLMDVLSIGRIVSRLSDSSSEELDGLSKFDHETTSINMVPLVLKIFHHYIYTMNVGHVAPNDDEALKTVDHKAACSESCWWNREWMSDINEIDHTLTKDNILSIKLPNELEEYFPQSSQDRDSDVFNSANDGLGSNIGHLMVRSSQHLLESFKAGCRRLSNYSSCTKLYSMPSKDSVSIIERMRDQVMKKIDTLFVSPVSVQETSPPMFQGHWPLPPSTQITGNLYSLVRSYSVSLGKSALQNGIVQQILAAKSTVLLDEFLWGPLVSGLLESCSSSSGLDSVSISNANSSLSDIMDNGSADYGISLRSCIYSAWIESCSPLAGEVETSFASRTTSYIKLMRWHVKFRPPFDAIIDNITLQGMSEMRDLILQAQWVWKTLSSTKKICIKFGKGTITTQTHACLLSMLTLLREIMNFVYSSIEEVFRDLVRDIGETEHIVHMKYLANKKLSALSHDGVFSRTMPLRAHMTSWMDACLHYGILVSRSVLYGHEKQSHHASMVSPSPKSFEEGISLAQAEVMTAQSALVPIFQRAILEHSHAT